MRGKVLDIADAAKPGLISGEDNQRYRYTLTDLRSAAPRTGQEVDFEPSGTDARDVYAIGLTLPAVTIPERDWVSFYLSPTGRISRRDYWLYGVLAIFASSLLVGWIPILGQIFTLATSWAGIAIAFKRCHDVGRSGWWLFLPLVPAAIAVIGGIIAGASNNAVPGIAMATVFGLIWLGLSVWLIFAVLIRRGDEGPNRFGPAPAATPL